MYNYPYYWQNMQQCNFNSAQFYSLQIQNVNCMQRVNEACTNVAFRTQQQRLEDIRESHKDFPKSCFNCKHKIYGFQKGSCSMFNYCADTDPFAPIRQCIYNDRAYWSPDDATAELMGVRRKIQEASQDVTISELKNRIELLRIQQLQTNIVATHKEPLKPEKKYTVYDLYELVFPDDPIKAHFDAERKRINEEYEKQKAIYEQMEIKPVNHVEIVQKQMGKPKINQEALQTWVEFEKYVSITFAAVYVFWVFVGIMLAFPVSVENGTRFLVDVTRIHSALFLAASSVSLAVAVFASRSK